jgi:hypothetical protein
MAAIANLDIVITSCTSIAHIAAGMGKETWVIVPILPYHTWTAGAPESNTSPYYKCVRLFRQVDHKKWNPTFQGLYTALEERFNLKHIDMPDEDKIIKRINLGCGTKKIDNFINVDKSTFVNPDEVVDLNVTPWPWKDNEYSHIFAKDILEHLGNTGEDFINIIKEMYRISDNGAIWEIQTPHWRSDTAISDPTHKRSLTIAMFDLFNKRLALERTKNGSTESMLAFDEDIDIEVCDSNFEFTEPFKDRISKNTISEEELTYSLNHLNNVALATRILIQVHKPGRIDFVEYKRAIDDQQQQS